MPAYGYAVAITGTTSLVGNPTVQRGLAPGKAYAFRRDPTSGEWRFAETLQASNAETGDSFGISLAADQGWAIIGAKSSWAYLFDLGADSGVDGSVPSEK